MNDTEELPSMHDDAEDHNSPINSRRVHHIENIMPSQNHQRRITQEEKFQDFIHRNTQLLHLKQINSLTKLNTMPTTQRTKQFDFQGFIEKEAKFVREKLNKIENNAKENQIQPPKKLISQDTANQLAFKLCYSKQCPKDHHQTEPKNKPLKSKIPQKDVYQMLYNDSKSRLENVYRLSSTKIEKRKIFKKLCKCKHINHILTKCCLKNLKKNLKKLLIV